MPYKVTVKPSTEPITLEEAKNHLKVDVSDDDALITVLITAARESAEQYTNRALITQTIEEEFKCFEDILLQRNPVQTVSSVTYTDTEEQEQTWDEENYSLFLTAEPAKILLKTGKSFPTDVVERDNAVKVTYIAGYTQASDVPKPIIQAMLLMIGKWYDNRADSIQKMPTASEFLLNNYRVSWF